MTEFISTEVICLVPLFHYNQISGRSLFGPWPHFLTHVLFHDSLPTGTFDCHLCICIFFSYCLDIQMQPVVCLVLIGLFKLFANSAPIKEPKVAADWVTPRLRGIRVNTKSHDHCPVNVHLCWLPITCCCNLVSHTQQYINVEHMT